MQNKFRSDVCMHCMHLLSVLSFVKTCDIYWLYLKYVVDCRIESQRLQVMY